MIQSDAASRLHADDLGWLTTVRKDGQPQSSYIWFHFDGSDILIISKPGSGKIRNMAHNSLVSFHLDGDGTKGDGVLTMDCSAVVSPAASQSRRLAAYIEKYESRIREDLKSTPEQYVEEFSAAVIVTPHVVRSW